jgi:hypothetical protein
MKAVDGLPAQPADVDERSQANLVRSARQQLEPDFRDDPILADERHDVGQRADGGDLDEARQQMVAAGAPAQRLHQFQRDADAREILVRIYGQSRRFVDHRQRHWQRHPARGDR